jgi:cold shock CspA family protein
MNDLVSGKVYFYNKKKGFGMISDASGRRYFFLKNQLFSDISKGDSVLFSVTRSNLSIISEEDRFTAYAVRKA